MTYSSDKTDGEGYSYTISTDSPWFDTVAAYAESTYNSTDEKKKEYKGNGLTLTQSAGDEKIYVVTGSSTAKDSEGKDKTTNLSAADFAEKLKVAKIADGSTITDTGIAIGTGTNENTPLTKSGMSLGYYLVVETVAVGSTEDPAPSVALAELTTTQPNAMITDKNVGPTIDKKQSVGNENYTTDAFDVKIGDTVNYQITGKVPDTTGYTTYQYIVTDTLTEGLTLKSTTSDGKVDPTVKITVNNVDKTSDWTVTAVYGVYNEDGTVSTTKKDSESKDVDYTSTDDNVSVVGFKASINLTATGEDGAEVVSSNKYTAGQDIVISYSASVNEKAVYGVETNTAKLTYSNNPNNSSATDETTPVETNVYDVAIDVLKYGDDDSDAVKDDNESTLAGAQFVLYKTEIIDGTSSTKYYYYDSTANEVKWNALAAGETLQTVLATDYSGNTKITALTTGSDGKFSVSGSSAPSITTGTGDEAKTLYYFGGLEEGTYYLLETKAPDGYNLLPDAGTITLTSTTMAAGEGDTSTLTVKAAKDGEQAVVINTAKLSVTSNVANQVGTLLPSTGGMGTTIFYIIGGILVVAAAVLLITRRRMNRE